MNGHDLWMWLLVGLIPYHGSWQLVRGERVLEMQAWFWSVEVRLRQQRGCQWTFCVPMIKRLRDAVWAAVKSLRGSESSEK